MKNFPNRSSMRWFISRIGLVMGFLVLLNVVYEHTLWNKDVTTFSRVRNRIDSVFHSGADIYLGESSNTSFNPWTDTLQESIAEFLQYYLPERRIQAVTHEGYHPGLFKQMLNVLPVLKKGERRTLWLGVNLRTCGPSAIFSANEASNQREALYYSHRPPLVTRIFMGLHFYDNRNEKERERLKFQWWRTHDLTKAQIQELPYRTALQWIDAIAKNYDTLLPEDLKGMMGAYVKEFAFVLDDDNPRVQDLKKTVQIAKEKGWNVVFHILPPNRYHAAWLFAEKGQPSLHTMVHQDSAVMGLPSNPLVGLMDYNYQFLRRRFFDWGVQVVDNYFLRESLIDNSVANGSFYTDQWYPTEHYNAAIRKAIADQLALHALEGDTYIHTQRRERVNAQLKQNNFPNWDIVMPLSDPRNRWIEKNQEKR
jgi:hypothetical protein